MKQSSKQVLIFVLCLLLAVGGLFSSPIFADFSVISFGPDGNGIGQSDGLGASGDTAKTTAAGVMASPFSLSLEDISNDDESFLVLHMVGYPDPNNLSKYEQLAGAEFIVYSVDENEKKYLTEEQELTNNIEDAHVWTTGSISYPLYSPALKAVVWIDSPGSLYIGNLDNGTYWLEQVRAPMGYALPEAGKRSLMFTVANIATDGIASLYSRSFINYGATSGNIHFNVQSSYMERYREAGHGELGYLAGAVFELDKKVNGSWISGEADGSGRKQWESDANGNVEIAGLDMGGEYQIRQIKAPDGFIQPDPDAVVKDFEVKYDMEDLGIVINDPNQYTFQIIAQENNEEKTPIEGVRYSVFASLEETASLEGDWIYLWDLRPTDEYGKLDFTVPYINDDATFRLAEASWGGSYDGEDGQYVLCEDSNSYRTGVIDPKKFEALGITELPVLYRKEKNAALVELHKYDRSDRNKSLPGAQFLLYRLDEHGDKEQYGIYSTNGDGYIRTQLPPGTYELKESVPPEGYKMPSVNDGVSVVVSDTGLLYVDGVPYTDGQIRVANDLDDTVPVKTITGYKVDADTYLPLEGAVFTLEKQEAGGRWMVVQTNITTDSLGKVELELPYGSYRFWEVKVPGDYELGGKPIGFTVNESSKDVYYITNKLKDKDAVYGDATIYKHRRGDKNAPLAGAEFVLERFDNGQWEEYLRGIVTDSKGEAHIDSLPEGQYRVSESKAPSGYQMDEGAVYDFAIDGKEVPVIEIANTRISTDSGDRDKYPGTDVPDDHDRKNTSETGNSSTVPDNGAGAGAAAADNNAGAVPDNVPDGIDNPGTGRPDCWKEEE